MRASRNHLSKYIRYDPDDGHCYRTADAGTKWRIGDRVGSRHSRGYVEMRVGGVRLFAHQAAWVMMTGEWPDSQIDHINGDRKDNRWSNLRLVDQTKNSANMKKRANNRSGYKGVVKEGPTRWVAYIHIGGKTRQLGSYKCPRIAHRAYVMAARFVWGEHARSD